MDKSKVLLILMFLFLLVLPSPKVTNAQTQTTPHYTIEKVWDSEDQGTSIYGLDWNPDGKYIAIGIDYKWLKVFNAKTGDYLWGLEIGGYIRSVDWSPDGKYIVAPNDFTKIYVIDVETQSIAWSKTFASGNWIMGAAWNPNGEYIAVGTVNYLYLFNREGKKLWVSAWQSSAYIWHIAWSHNGDKIAIDGGQYGYSVIVYSLSGEKLWEYKTGNDVESLDWSPNDRCLAVGSKDGKVYVFDEIGNLLWSKDMEADVYNVAWDPSGEYLAVSGGFGTALFTKNGELKWTKQNIKTDWSAYAHGNLEWNTEDLLAVGGTDKLYILDKNGNILAESGDLGSSIRRVAWSPADQTKIAAVGDYGKLYVWRLVGWSNVVIWTPGIKIKVCFSGPYNFCDVISVARMTYNLPSGKYNLSFRLLEVPPNTVGNVLNSVVFMEYTFEPGKSYSVYVPTFNGFLARINISNPLPFGVDIRVAWDKASRIFWLSGRDSLTLFAVPGLYNISIASSANIIGDKSSINVNCININVTVGEVREYSISDLVGRFVFRGVPRAEIIIEWGNYSYNTTIPEDGYLTLYAIPGKYDVSVYVDDILGSSYVAHLSGIVVSANDDTVADLYPPRVLFVNPLQVPVEVNVSWNGGIRSFEVGSGDNVTLYAAPGTYRVMWRVIGVYGYGGGIGGSRVIDVGSSDLYSIVLGVGSVGFGKLILANNLTVGYNVMLTWSNGSMEIRVDEWGSASVFLGEGDYVLRISPDIDYVSGRYVVDRSVHIEANETVELDVGEIAPISRVVVRGVPGARYRIEAGNISLTGVLPGNGMVGFYVPSGSIRVSVEPLDEFHSAIVQSFMAGPGQVIVVNATGYPFSILFYTVVGLMVAGTFAGLYLFVIRPRLGIELMTKEVVMNVTRELVFRVRNKGLLGGVFKVSIEINGRRVYDEAIRLGSRGSQLIRLDVKEVLRGGED